MKISRRFQKFNTLFIGMTILIILIGIIAFPSFTITTRGESQEEINGIISGDTIWTIGSSPYIITGNVLIENNVTLTIEPGVEIKFDDKYYMQVEGKLIADGTQKEMITFTSNKQNPSIGDWDSIKFMENCDNGSSISYCNIEYGGYALIIRYNNPYAVPNILNSNIVNNWYGIYYYRVLHGQNVNSSHRLEWE